jgi:hypothetical protein
MHIAKQQRAYRKEQVAKYLTNSGRKGDADPLCREWEKARDEAQVAQDRFQKASGEFVRQSGKTWSKDIQRGVHSFYKDAADIFLTTEMSHSPAFISNVSEVSFRVLHR